jgi:hypothetical protein
MGVSEKAIRPRVQEPESRPGICEDAGIGPGDNCSKRDSRRWKRPLKNQTKNNPDVFAGSNSELLPAVY